MATPEPYTEAAELVAAAMLNLSRASARLDSPDPKPLEHYEINRAWLALEEIERELRSKARKARAR